MNPETLLNAIGEIDDSLIAEAYSKHHPRIVMRRFVALVAALVMTITLGVSALAAADVAGAYDLLYSLFPAYAQQLKPVRMSCVNNGIEMEVVSADVRGNEADVLISLRDLEGHRVDATTDLFDSYVIRTPLSLEGTCSEMIYDEASETAAFLVHLAQPDGTRFDKKKITFSVSCFLSGKQTTDGLLPIDLSEAELNPQTQTDVDLCGGTDHDYDAFLVPDELFVPMENVSITAMGFIGDRLHVQAHFMNLSTTDSHGGIYLTNGENDCLDATAELFFYDADQTGHYEEFVFDISPAELEGYQLYGWFESSEGYYTGDWEVTFKL